ncbi:polyphosphate kinase 2 family protein [Dubosiella newyorkensis]|jgi:PPK2 family polyphosphate:nucleotide phosphotransferase|uniref:Polyphosphate kinase-2-related domain-containing protein n=3 Tax=Dubosiella newyorkensis TaxID=1862672 RepID=A0A1U7NPA9_9FIRM|nr:polyphosphate kinase 2 family protein [Dubosiella newyorkensis]MCI9040438.1 polyphosphate kinase 2 family protein [Dubosiella newyorkensis]OLU47471.1 hypothetical protein BO225_02705 [Dubosiella newyorkensis]
MIENYKFDGSKTIDLKKLPTNSKKDHVNKQKIIQETEANQLKIQSLQEKLYAQGIEGLIIVLQARDAAGKDATIKHVLSGINPQGIDVHSFKQPTHEELAHDFLWRFNKALPRRGKIAIFNRSYYEEVLVVKVHQLYKNYALPQKDKEDNYIQRRYEQINNYEKYLEQNGYRIIKIFLNVSKETQKERFLERIDQPDKNWKFSEADLAERALWDEYTKAYESMVDRTSTKTCPWYVFPADQKWYTRYLVSEVIFKTLKEMDPHYPTISAEQKEHLLSCKEALLSEDGHEKLFKEAVKKEMEKDDPSSSF